MSTGTESGDGVEHSEWKTPVFDEAYNSLDPIVLDEEAWEALLPPEREIVPAQVITLPSAEGRHKIDTNDPRNRNALQREFKKTAQSSKNSLDQLGLHREFSGVLSGMLKETRIIVSEPTTGDVEPSSEFYISKEGQPVAERLFILNPQEVKNSASRLTEAADSLSFIHPDKEVLRMVALEWVMGQMVMELANTACFLRQEYGDFKPGFGGYTPIYMTRRTIALNFLAENTLSPELFNNPDVETERIISGFGLYILSKVMLQRGIVKNEREADLTVLTLVGRDRQKLDNKDDNTEVVTDKAVGRAAALSPEELSERIRYIYPEDKPSFSDEAMKELADDVEW